VNPLLEEALKVDPDIISADSWRLPSSNIDAFAARGELVKRYAWAIPNEEALNAIAEWSPIVEIGAGTGYWAYLLTLKGADLVAYDIAPGRNRWCDANLYFPVAIGGPEKASEHSDRTLFLCWPPYDDEMAERALLAYRGERLVYIGEWCGGCCANDRFFDLIETGWRLVREVRIPQWWGLHDSVFMYERNRDARKDVPRD